MPTLTRPGVYVDTSSFPTYVGQSPGVAAACFVGANPRGPLTPTVVHSWKEYTVAYGGFEVAYPPSLLSLAVYCFFSAGGTAAVIIRAVNSSTSGPTTASVALDDSSGGTPAVPTLMVSAQNPGAWGSQLAIDIAPGTVLDPVSKNPITFTMTVKYLGTAPANVVERWVNLSMTPGSSYLGQNNYAPDVINAIYNGSLYISVEDLQSPSQPPLDLPMTTTASLPLVGGSDGTGGAINPDGTQNVPFTPDLHNALLLLDTFPDQPFVINVPGVTQSGDVTTIIGYAEQRGDGFVVIDSAPNTDYQSMADFALALSSSPQAAIYYPNVIIGDPYSLVPGRTRKVYPGGFVVGQYLKTDATRGVAKAPAGIGTSLLGAYGLEMALTNDQQGTLTQANVNCLISIPGAGVVIWGARTLSPYLYTRYVPTERSIIYLKTQFVALTRFAVFEPNDYVLWNALASVLSQFLTAFWQSGGLSGNSSSDAFYVICDSSINTPSTIQQGIVNIEVGVALETPAEFVVITIGQWAGGSSVSVSTT